MQLAYISDVLFSQGIVATYLRCGEISIENLLQIPFCLQR